MLKLTGLVLGVMFVLVGGVYIVEQIIHPSNTDACLLTSGRSALTDMLIDPQSGAELILPEYTNIDRTGDGPSSTMVLAFPGEDPSLYARPDGNFYLWPLDSIHRGFYYAGFGAKFGSELVWSPDHQKVMTMGFAPGGNYYREVFIDSQTQRIDTVGGDFMARFRDYGWLADSQGFLLLQYSGDQYGNGLPFQANLTMWTPTGVVPLQDLTTIPLAAWGTHDQIAYLTEDDAKHVWLYTFSRDQPHGIIMGKPLSIHMPDPGEYGYYDPASVVNVSPNGYDFTITLYTSLYVVDMDGQVHLSTTIPGDQTPQWTNDGNTVIFLQNTSSGANLVAFRPRDNHLDLVGTHVIPTADRYAIPSVGFYTDSQDIIYDSEYLGQSLVNISNLDGSHRVTLAMGVQNVQLYPLLRGYFYMTAVVDGSMKLLWGKRDGSGIHNLDKPDLLWGDDLDQRIVIQKGTLISLLNLSTGKIRDLFDEIPPPADPYNDAAKASWSPDFSQIAISYNTNAYVFDHNGNLLRQIDNIPDNAGVDWVAC